MSGPKVVRIVTREEVQAVCRQHLRAFEAVAEQLRNCATKHEMWSDELAAELKAKAQQFADLFERDHFLDLQKSVPAQVEFLKAEMRRIESVAVERATNEKQKARRLSDAARSLAAALDGVEVPQDLRAALTRAQNTTSSTVAVTEATLNKAFAALREANSKTATDEKSELAKRLGAGEKSQTFVEWLTSQPPTPGEGNAPIDRLIAEIEVMGNTAAAQTFMAKAAKVLNEPMRDRRGLLIDSLTIELSDYVRAQRTVAADLGQLRTAVSDLSAYDGTETEQLRAEARAVMKSGDAKLARELAARIETHVGARMLTTAALARRKAILGGLAALGYEVREGMALAWAESGRLVIKKPGATDYGVELGAASDAERVQVRLVGSAHPVEIRTAARDRDAETIWCSDFDRLRQSLAAHGGDLKIEQALAVGAQPVKTVVFEQAGLQERGAVSAPKTVQRRMD